MNKRKDKIWIDGLSDEREMESDGRSWEWLIWNMKGGEERSRE